MAYEDEFRVEEKKENSPPPPLPPLRENSTYYLLCVGGTRCLFRYVNVRKFNICFIYCTV